MSKKTIVIIAAALVVIVGGFFGIRALVSPLEEAPATTPAPTLTPTPTPTPTPEPTEEPEPETTAGFIKSAKADVVFAVLNRGDTVEYIGEAQNAEGYSIVKYGDVYGLIERRFLRLDSEAEYEAWTGYSGGGAMLYEDIDLTVEIGKQSFNTEVNVIDEFENCYLVEVGEAVGFMAIKTVSATPNVAYSGGGGGSSGDNGGGGSSSGGVDGGDIMLSGTADNDFRTCLLAATVEQEGDSTENATVRVDGTGLYAGLFEYGDEVRVLSIDGETAKIYIYKKEATMDSRYVRLETEEAYQTWEGFVASDGWTYTGPDLTGKSEKKLTLNTKVEVLEKFDGVYLVSVDGEMLYMTEAGVSETQIQITYSGGGGSSGDNGGGGTDSGWTVPAL